MIPPQDPTELALLVEEVLPETEDLPDEDDDALEWDSCEAESSEDCEWRGDE